MANDSLQECPWEWQEPRTAQEAEALRLELAAVVQSVQTQLGDRDRLVNGRRLSNIEYWQWRKKATAALRFRLEDLRRAKALAREFNRVAYREATESAGDSAGRLLANFTRAFFELKNFVGNILARHAEIIQENESLRAQLAELTADPQNRTPAGPFEEWRDAR